MLLSSDYSIEKRVVFDFVFDDGETKQIKLSLGDIAEITYNGGKTRKTITGRIVRIEAGNETVTHPVKVCHEPIPVNCDHYHWWIMVDGSEYNQNKMERIDLKRVIDINLIAGEGSTSTISSPVGESRVTDFRLLGNVLQVSTDHQQHWLNVCKLPDTDVAVDPRDQAFADKISALIPNCVNPVDKAELILALIKLLKDTMRDRHRTHKKNKEESKNKFIEELIEKLRAAGGLDNPDHVDKNEDVASSDEVLDMVKKILGDEYEEDVDEEDFEDDDTASQLIALLSQLK